MPSHSLNTTIPMFKPGITAQHERARAEFATFNIGNLDAMLVQPFPAFCQEMRLTFPADIMPAMERLTGYSAEKYIAVTHGERAPIHAPAAALAVWSMLCCYYGRAYVVSPYMRTWSTIESLLIQVAQLYPVLTRHLTFSAHAVHLDCTPARRIEWLNPQEFTEAKLASLKGCTSFVFVDGAEHCTNGFLEALRAAMMPGQPLLVSGVPVSAGGAFRAICEEPGVKRIRLSALDAANANRSQLESLQEEHREESDYYRSFILGLFPKS
ncbi:hypothetical protein [Nissabacter sp. SGAir0207]|uniref:hypothetical protein n=1 Tax=Nissabacter sp. SGAir0207 TaxID=2126321 RepID=UPI0010CD2997|nr:hypothetical protein [Nissabacter sp. SGAir0207]QCR38744.1 hypothetical protein C1N62_21670 [Nissabacter sp. SGAir0207]